MTPDEERILNSQFGPGVAERFEGARRLIVLPRVRLPAGCAPAEVFGIYVAGEHGGYETRLFLESPARLPSGATPPTTTAVLCGRTLYAASIRGVPPTLPLYQQILAHIVRYEAAA